MKHALLACGSRARVSRLGTGGADETRAPCLKEQTRGLADWAAEELIDPPESSSQQANVQGEAKSARWIGMFGDVVTIMCFNVSLVELWIIN